MWLFPWNPNSDFFSQYDIDEQVSSFSEHSIWALFKARKRGTSEALSIFRFDIREPQSQTLDQAKASLKRIKTLRHPSILKYIDSCENEKTICIVTEGVVPLATYLEEANNKFTDTQREFSISYGLLNVAKGIDFMNNQQLNHNNINIHSIFVNSSGVWKIGGLEYVCSVEDKPHSLHEGLDEKYTPPERLDPTKARHPGGKFAVDSWGMGCLVWECFNKPLTPSSSVKTVGKMPKQLSVYYNKLVQSSPRHRVSPMDFINNCKEASVFFASIQLDLVSSLDEIQFPKEPTEKEKFFNKLEQELESFPSDMRKNKLLPDLINAFEYGEAGAAILNPIFKIGEYLSEDEFQKKLVPCIIKLYSCKDRATRSKLLQRLDTYINFLSSSVINDKLFPQIVQGFLDSNFAIRGQTVKSMSCLAPKLNSVNLNEELVKHLTRLAICDEEGGIRANTTVCLTKIAKHLSSETQSTILLSTLLRIMRDSFPPARHAATAGITTNESLFKDADCATKIMPALCHLCMDTDVNVRRLAFHSLKKFIDRLEKGSEKDVSVVTGATIPNAITTTSSDGDKSSNLKRPTTPDRSVAPSRTTNERAKIRNGLKAMSIKDE